MQIYQIGAKSQPVIDRLTNFLFKGIPALNGALSPVYMGLERGREGSHAVPEEAHFTHFIGSVGIQVAFVMVNLIDPRVERILNLVGVPQKLAYLESGQVPAHAGPSLFLGPCSGRLGFLAF
jgi:hypothetical protein